MYSIIYRQGFIATEIPQDIRDLMYRKTYRDNPNICFDDLALLKLSHYNFQHKVQEGEMVVVRKLAKEVLEIFAQLFDAEYEIEKIRLCDYYDADDERSMSDNNSSAFNYRVVADTNSISMHSYGRAVDINPLINPYIVGEKVMPANAVQYCDRKLAFSHKIDHDDEAYKVFTSHGWKWGGDWANSKDYQHFVKPFKRPLKTAFHRLRDLIK